MRLRGNRGRLHFGRGAETPPDAGEFTCCTPIAVILLIAWLLGLVGTFTIGPIIHVLLVVALVLFVVGLVLFVVGLLGGRRSLA